MDWHRVRHVASGILVVGALVSGGTVGNVLLLGSADYAGDPVGHLSARSGSQSAVQSTADDPGVAPAGDHAERRDHTRCSEGR